MGASKRELRENIRILLDKYDRKHLYNQVKRKKNIDMIYDELCKEAARLGTLTQFSDPDAPFYFSDYPETQKKIDQLIAKHASKMQTLIEQGDEDEWMLSVSKNNAMIGMLTAGTKIKEATLKAWKQPHLDALAAFQQRKQNGMGLSDRVWNLSQQAKEELELALDIGLGEGKSAAELSRDVRRFLNEPHKLFRRVRDKHGVLRLSKAARAYHPGQGVYRSSYKNAIRMTGTENNMAYRTADHEKWGKLDFVIGIEIRLSNNHTLNGKPFHDICDEMVGRYPKDFKFTGWHPQCRCFAIPILADWEEQLKVMDMRDAGQDVSNYHYKGEVTEMPKGYNDWMKDNAERIANAKSLPYFIKDNYLGGKVENGLRWKQKKGMTVQERARLRHEARTEEQRLAIQTDWNRRRIESNGDGYNLTSIERSIRKYGVDRTEFDALMARPLKYDKRTYEFPELVALEDKYRDLARINTEKAFDIKKKLLEFKNEAQRISLSRAQKYAVRIERHIAQIDSRQDSVAYWISQKESVQLENARNKLATFKQQAKDILNNWMLRMQKSNTLHSIAKECEKLKIDEVPVVAHRIQMQTNDIINSIAGGDKTKGSCSSLALTYVGNKAGYEVLDFRGGESCSFFSRNSNIDNIVKRAGGIVIEEYNDFDAASKLFAMLEQKKEYYFGCAQHVAIIRNKKGVIEYLELQSSNPKIKGWHKLDKSELKNRFGAKTRHSVFGFKYKLSAELIDIDELGKADGFKEMLGYINTKTANQQKGLTGTIK